jgi:hypothetical protein
MKYLKSFSALDESNRFLHMKEVLDTLEELSLDFTDEGQPLLEESIQISESDIDEIEDIIDDFNSECADEGQFHIKADLNFAVKMRKSFSGNKRSVGQYVVTLSDMSSSYDGFQFHEFVPLCLRLMSKFGVDSIELGILSIHSPSRQFKTFTKAQLESYLDKNYLMDQVSNISISLEI